jgi:glycosyltransferase involved in cell wall biosynthesis
MKKKILFITLTLEGGGAEKIFSGLIQKLHSEFDIVLVTFYRRGRFLEEILSVPGIDYHCLNAERGNTLSFAARLRGIIKKTSPDKLISFLYYPNIVTYLALISMDLPVILSERSNHRYYLSGTFKNKVWKWLIRKAFRKALAIVAVSNESKAAIVEDFNIAEKKIVTIYNGISFPILDKLKEEPVTDFEFEKDLIYIIAVGSLNKAKNYPLLIESFNIFHSKHNNTRLIILGKGEMKDEIYSHISTLHLNEAVQLMGYRDNPWKYMKYASCYVLSSRWEGFPNTLLEAMYINGHVISTDCPTGPSEIISNNEDGILCERDNPESMAGAMEKMCLSEDFRKIVFENSRKKIAKFDEQKMVLEYRNLLMK